MSFFRDLKALSEQPEGLSADPLDEAELLHSTEGAILISISEDLMSTHHANPLKLTELCEARAVDVCARLSDWLKAHEGLAIEALRV
jgi:hypothetical protein